MSWEILAGVQFASRINGNFENVISAKQFGKLSFLTIYLLCLRISTKCICNCTFKLEEFSPEQLIVVEETGTMD